MNISLSTFPKNKTGKVKSIILGYILTIRTLSILDINIESNSSIEKIMNTSNEEKTCEKQVS